MHRLSALGNDFKKPNDPDIQRDKTASLLGCCLVGMAVQLVVGFFVSNTDCQKVTTVTIMKAACCS